MRAGPGAAALAFALTVLAATLPACRSGRGPASPTSAADLLREARALRRAGDPETALARYGAARDADPAHVPAHLGYVGLLEELGRRSLARAGDAARSAAPTALPVDHALAERTASDQSSAALRAIYRRAAQLEPDAVWWPLGLLEVELVEAEAWSRRAAEARRQGDRAKETHALAQAGGALSRSEEAVRRAQALAPTLAEVDLYLGHLRALEGDLAAPGTAREQAYQAAAEAFERATERDPDLVEAWTGLADVRGRLDEQGPSLSAWVEAARRSPSDAYARLEVARRLQAIGRRKEAVHEYRALAELRPRDAEPWLRIGDAQAEDERWEAAARAYREALARDSEALEAHARLASVLEQQGLVAEARDAWQRYLDQGGERREEAERRLEDLLRGTR